MVGRRTGFTVPLQRAQEELLTGGRSGLPASLGRGVRLLVRESWERCQALGVDPDASPPMALTDDELAAERDRHPLALVLPVVRRLLVEHAVDDDLVVAVTDASGRLLWVEGHAAVRARCEGMHFAAGVRWDEGSAGTNAPGVALALDRPVSVLAAEHWGRAVQPYSCSAAPVHDPRTGELLGALDLTGDDRAAAPAALALVRATVAAVEGELLLRWQGGSTRTGVPGRRVAARAADQALALHALGTHPSVVLPDGSVRHLSLRHAELLLLLAAHPEGLSGDALAVELDERDLDPVTVRAEVSRLRRVLGPDALLARPYRLARPVLEVVQQVRAHLDAGRVSAAVAAYPSRLLADSDAPGVVAMREALEQELCAAARGCGDPETLLACARGPAGHTDAATWRECVRTLPPGPDRERARAQLQGLGAVGR